MKGSTSSLARCLPLLAALSTGETWAADISSFLFEHNIKSNGSGLIDLFKPKSKDRSVTGPLLEAFRQDNLGELVFAVDVNEASSGTETADSQGIAIQSAQLSIMLPGETLIIPSFRTPTRSILQPVGSVGRYEYFTLIGTAGTNRISPNENSELTASSLDETLYFSIDRDLSTATGASLEIVLVNTDVALGDPEAFYDYSNGYEEVALLTRDDVLYLEALAPGRFLAPLVITGNQDNSLNWTHFPSSQDYFVVAYEDLYPARGDYDFNDLVVGYQVSLGMNSQGDVVSIRGRGYLMARGAHYDHDWHLRIELPEWATGNTAITLFPADAHLPMQGYPRIGDFMGFVDLLLVEHVATVYSDGNSTYVNTFDYQAPKKGPRFEFQVSLDIPVAADQIGSSPFDPFLYVHDTGYEIHLVDRQAILPYSRNQLEALSDFRDPSGFPFALVIPDSWHPPLAAVDMGLAYPSFMEFVRSQGGGSTSWYAEPVSDKIKLLPTDVWRW